MDIAFRDHFIRKWKEYFNGPELPIILYYADTPGDAAMAPASDKWSCIICQLAEVRKGKSLAFSKETVRCAGGKRYLGFSKTVRPDFEYFLSCGIGNRMEGERYIRTPEMVVRMMDQMQPAEAPGKYIVFKRWDKLEEADNPDVVIFFCTPDVLSGLFTLANFDQVEPNGTFTPFGSGCSSIVHHPFLEKDAERPRAVIGMFDPSARPCVPEGTLTFAVPFVKFMKMAGYMDESFLITPSWEKVRKRIS